MAAAASYNPLQPAHLDVFRAIAGGDYVLTGEAERRAYGRDETENLCYPPAVVIRPRTAAEISALLRYCNQEGIPVTPRGAGTGLSGGALPQFGGVLLSVDRMNSILEIDERNLQVTTEPGVITEVLQEAVKARGLFYPPDPASRGSCFIGGNVAVNSGGPKALKYGVVRDYVLNLEVVLPTGDIINTGANVLKNATGYPLTQLMVGSEGTLGIITRIVLKLLPHPRHDMLLLVPFRSLEKAGEAVSAIFRAGFVPSALELVEVEALRLVADRLNDHTVPISADTEAHLLLECDGNHPGQLLSDMEAIAALLENYDCGELYFAEDQAQKDRLWRLRRRVAEIVKLEGYTIEEDTVVPRAELPALIRGVKALGRQYGFDSMCYGHAGDGNLHIRIRKPGAVYSLGNPEIVPALRALFELVRSLGGTISGEHGIGLLQKEYLDIAIDPVRIALMRGIKRQFDPNQILNPGKIFDL